ncbi:MAG: hypothetical protein GQ574_18365 [Crocinitomix sp.]|nr:hypothetical protein [Crocinitomix sp.]
MDSVSLYDQLIENNPAIERKGKTTPYTSINGHMFSFLSKEGDMALRLSAADREAFMEIYKTQLMEQHGRIMKEYVHVPQALFAKSDELAEYLQKSFDYVSQLKPKPSKKKK